jgi:NADPH-dependent 2,4-dienoyl-CoA reductase/sulfur reductase-like enzyme/rhodanese-related sulfurtransferase
MSDTNRIVIVGGVAGGASTAARARRLSEDSAIVIYERGPHVSFANCGLPYHIGGVIPEEGELLVATPELLRQRFAVDVRTESEVIEVDRERREVEVRNLRDGTTYRDRYSHLVLSPGASPVRPNVSGIELPGIFLLRTIPDSRRIRNWIEEKRARRAVVVGAGFIGVEVAENLVRRGLEVTVLECTGQILPPLDPEMTVWIEEHMMAKGVRLRLGDGVSGFESATGGGILVRTQSKSAIEADVVVVGVGVRPEVDLARKAGLALGGSGGILVDEQMRTSDPRIFAVGDAVEVRDVITGAGTLVPLAGPASRQGRIAADSIFGRPSRFRGVQGTAVCGAFDLTAACTGASERALRRAGVSGFDAIYLHPSHHVGYFPGAKPIHLKLIFRREDGRILGAQAVGERGVARRIDVISMAIQKGGTVFDLEDAELCYAPQYGASKDPVNQAGMIAANVVRGDHPVARWDEAEAEGAFLLDVREPSEFQAGHVPGAVNVPLGDLRVRLGEIPDDRTVYLYCGVGQRAYYATRILLQRGRQARNLSGGIQTYRAWRTKRP